MDTDCYATFIKEQPEVIPANQNDDEIEIEFDSHQDRFDEPDDEVQIIDEINNQAASLDPIPMDIPKQAEQAFTDSNHKLKMDVLENVAEHDSMIIREKIKARASNTFSPFT